MHSTILESMEEIQSINANQLAKRTTLLDSVLLLAISVTENTVTNYSTSKMLCFLRECITKELLEGTCSPVISKEEWENWIAIDCCI